MNRRRPTVHLTNEPRATKYRQEDREKKKGVYDSVCTH